MNFLALLPGRDWLYIGAFTVLLVGGIGFVRHERAIGAARVEEVRQAEHAQAQAVAASAIADSQAETNRRIAASQEIVHATQVSASAVVADAASAAHERDALQLRVDTLVRASRVPGNPAAAAASAPVDGSDPIGVLAYVLGRSDARASVVDRLADERRIRAEGCERSYDALKK